MARRVRIGIGDLVRVIGTETYRVVIDVEWTSGDDRVCRTARDGSKISKRAVVKDYLESELVIVVRGYHCAIGRRA